MLWPDPAQKASTGSTTDSTSDSITGSTRTRVLAAVLCLAVSWIHVQDQGGFPGDKTPHYIGVGYYLLEATGVLTALLLLLTAGRSQPARVAGWLLALGVAFGPLIGFVLSRGPGLPDYSDDRGNWTEPLGIVSVAVEAVLLVLAITAFLAEAQGVRRLLARTAPSRARG
ncbi:peptidoglycan/LPS O-acetylase OafA/YrhL [Kitasatospora sp. MAP12-15]|uniref:hypothetical protein n=1 Tax=unclassified Kitasatospora TaxID=2633591 RepID=UPI002476DBCB|nr:hypothetical protein [Kitasatospora sp. MAP12-44]MDH6115086.1 peptidoglycan/LPS O-acetylase OafA/YrhL [Kitasatospora sp. MAP12-44]